MDRLERLKQFVSIWIMFVSAMVILPARFVQARFSRKKPVVRNSIVVNAKALSNLSDRMEERRSEVPVKWED